MQQELSNRISQDNFFRKENPTIVRWIVALAMVANDLSFFSKKIKDTQIDYEKIYYFRLALAYMREIAKVVGEAKENEEIKLFVSGLPNEAQGEYLKITQFLGSYEDSGLVKGVLKVPRDEVFHYPDINEKYWSSLYDDVMALDKIFVELSKSDETIMGARYRFIDILLWKRVKQRLSEEIVNQLSLIAVNLISFIDCVFEQLIIKNNGQNKI